MSEGRKELANQVIDLMTEGHSTRTACKMVGLPMGTFLRWCDNDAALADQYTRARAILLEHMAEDTLEIADEAVGTTDNGGTDSGAVAKQRLQVDTRKWLLSKLAPKKYGDKIEHDMKSSDGSMTPPKIITLCAPAKPEDERTQD